MLTSRRLHIFGAAGPPPGGGTEINEPKLPEMSGTEDDDPAGVATGILHLAFLCFELLSSLIYSPERISFVFNTFE